MTSSLAALVEEQESRVITRYSVYVVEGCCSLEVALALKQGGNTVNYATAGGNYLVAKRVTGCETAPQVLL